MPKLPSGAMREREEVRVAQHADEGDHLVGADRDLVRRAGLEHLGRALDRAEDDAELDADGRDVERRVVARVALEGDAARVHEEARDAAVGPVDDVAQRVFEHAMTRLKGAAASAVNMRWREG